MNRNRIISFSVLLAALLSACGGGAGGVATGPDAGPAAPAPTASAPPPGTRVSALGSSDSTVSLGWTPLAGSGGYRVERQLAGGGSWTAVAELPEPARRFIDDGLSPASSYRYRLLARADGRELALAEASTGSDALARSEAGSVGAELARASIGAAGGRVASADGTVLLEVPAGAFAAATEVVLRRLQNTAPGGRGEGVAVALAAAPARPLQLSLGLEAADASDADGLRIALQRGDGSWLALPAHAAAATSASPPSTLQAALPVDVGLATASLARPLAASTGAAAATEAGGGVSYLAVKYIDLYLSPRTASVPVNGQLTLTPYARTLYTDLDCEADPDSDACLLPIVQPKPAPLMNNKAGYQREWRVQDIVGGNPALGTVVAPPGAAGAFYLAPKRAPSPNPVSVSFHSTHQKSGRAITLRASVEVREPYWTGTAQGTLGAADLAFSFGADAIWSLAADGEADSYSASGGQLVSVINIGCVASASPSTAPLPPGALKIDSSSSPARYQLDVGSLWNTVITGSCPGRPGQASVAMLVPGRLQVSGTVSGDGRRVEGRTTANGVDWSWSFVRHD
jgi:hypothetical protein